MVEKQKQSQDKNPKIIKKTVVERKQVPEIKLYQGDIITKQVSQRLKHCNFDKQLFCVRFDPDDQKIATSYNDGDVFIFNLSTGKIEIVFDAESKTPTSSLRWKPLQPQLKLKNILLYSNSDGTLYQVHVSSGKKLWKEKEENNSVLCLDYSKDGNTFATGGRDSIIRLYDDEKKAMKLQLKGENWQKGGHSNRIFSIKFISDQPEFLISAGADKNIFFWDLRVQHSVNKIFGPKILGDSLDYKNNQILACSYSMTDNLQLYDFGTQKLISQFNWVYGNKEFTQNVYSAQFTKNYQNYILAGSCGANEVKMFDPDNDFCSLFTVSTNESVYSVDSGNLSSKFAFGNSFGSIYAFNLSDSK